MNPPQSSPDLYLHVKVVISIIVGLCITTLLNGFARFVQHPKRAKVSILHLGWAASLLLWIIHFWWWEFRLTLVPQWTFAIYFFVILYAILFYFLCTLLFPSDLHDYSGYEDYFISRRKWFFGFLAATQGLRLPSFLRDRIPNTNRGEPRHLLYCDVYQEPPHPTDPAGRLPALSSLFHTEALRHRVTLTARPAFASRSLFLPTRRKSLKSPRGTHHVSHAISSAATSQSRRRLQNRR